MLKLHTAEHILHANKVMLKTLKLGLSSMWIDSFQMSKLDLEKAEEWEIRLPTSIGSWKKAREFQKKVYFCFIDYAKAFDCVGHNKPWKILRWEYQTTWPVSWETCMQVRKQQFLEIELDMGQQTASK